MTGERELTRRLAHFFGTDASIRVGIGDDAAVVRNPQRDSVVCCDPVIEGVHFTAADPPHRVGHKAVNRNLSDLAAMGAVADWLLVSLVLPQRWPAARRDALLRGIRDAARGADCRVVGGDVATSRGPLVVTVTAGGHLAGPRPLLRSGARPGDRLYVSGPLGGSRVGHHLRFRPPLAAGAWLARQSGVTSAIDVSDGLLLDLATVLQHSGGLGAELVERAIPVRAAARQLAAGDPERALRHALEDGEDHVLLWTMSARSRLAGGGPLTARARRPIGTVTQAAGLWLCQRDGRRRRLQARGFEHRLER